MSQTLTPTRRVAWDDDFEDDENYEIVDGLPADADTTVVMLDGAPRFDHIDPDLTIFWGAYLGSPDEITLSGRLGTVGPEILRLRAEARTRHGWIMDIYLLRKPDGSGT